MYVTWQLSIISFNDKTTYLEGTILSHNSISNIKHNSLLNHLSIIIGSYFKSCYKNSSIEIEINNNKYQSQTNEYGTFSLLINKGFDKIEELSISNNGKNFPVIQSYPYHFNIPLESFGIISDIDDTIIKSHTLNHFKRISTTLFKRAQNRNPIDFTHQLFKHLKSFKPTFFYVSRSENNLFSYLNQIIEFHHLPNGALFLTPFLKWYRVFKPKKPIDHKFNVIKKILDYSGSTSYILIGDDTQQDMSIYLRVIKNYRPRVKMIIIRQVNSTHTNIQQNNWNAIRAEGIPALYFKPDDIFSPNLLSQIF